MVRGIAVFDVTTRSATGTCGATAEAPASRPTGGARWSRAARGSTTRSRSSTTTTPSCRSSRTSTGATPRSAEEMFDIVAFWLGKGVDGLPARPGQLPRARTQELRDNPRRDRFAALRVAVPPLRPVAARERRDREAAARPDRRVSGPRAHGRGIHRRSRGRPRVSRRWVRRAAPVVLPRLHRSSLERRRLSPVGGVARGAAARRCLAVLLPQQPRPSAHVRAPRAGVSMRRPRPRSPRRCC